MTPDAVDEHVVDVSVGSVDDSSPVSSGEGLVVEERLVVAPRDGRFRIVSGEHSPAKGDYVLAGQVVGHVLAPDGEPVPIRSRFSGWAMGFLLPDGCPVRPSEPVLWLRRL